MHPDMQHSDVANRHIQIEQMRENSLPPQERKVLEHLRHEGTITNVEAQMVHRIRSLSRRITTLQRNGWKISTVDKEDCTGQRYRRYKLEGFEPEGMDDE